MKKLFAMMATAAAVFAIPATASATQNNGNNDHKAGLCHKTASPTNPYVFIEVDEHSVQTHLDHHGDVLVGDATNCDKQNTPPTPVPCPPPTEVKVPVLIYVPVDRPYPVPGPVQYVDRPGPVQTITLPGETKTKVVVVTSKRKKMKCERRFGKNGRLVIVCRRIKLSTEGAKARQHAKRPGATAPPGTLTG